MRTLVLLLLSIGLPRVHGVSGDKVKPVLATEGESVTLHTNYTFQSDDMILWSFGPDDTVIVRDSVMKFTDRIKLDKSTGSLTINNITTDFSGIYKLHDVRKSSYKSFNVMVYARLPVPVIIRSSSQCSSSSCSVVCSVVNVSHVTLSWLKGHSLLSSISASDLSISLSLPLEVEDQEKNTYSCEINNSITHQTTHLDISGVCHPCEAEGLSLGVILGISAGVLSAVILGVVVTYCLYKKLKKAGGNVQEQEDIPLSNGPLPPNGQEVANPHNGQQERNPLIETDGKTSDQERFSPNLFHAGLDQMKRLKVKQGETIILKSGVTHIQMNDLLRWKYADYRVSDSTTNFMVIAACQKRNNRFSVKNVTDGKFINRLQLDRHTGDLTITNMRVKDSGHYKVEVKSDTNPLTTTIIVSVRAEKSRASTQTRGEDLNETMLPLLSEDSNDTSSYTVKSLDSFLSSQSKYGELPTPSAIDWHHK